MIWEKIKNHFFDDFTDEITMDLPPYIHSNLVQSILKGNLVMINKESLLKKIRGVSNGRLILGILFALFALIAIFYSSEETSIGNLPITEESMVQSAETANNTIISTNLPVETITSIEKTNVESGLETKKITTHTVSTNKKIDNIVDDYVIKTSKPLVITINSKDKKEIALIYDYKTKSPSSNGAILINSTLEKLSSSPIDIGEEKNIQVENKENTLSEISLDNKVNSEIIKKDKPQKIITVTNTVIQEKENLTVSKEKIEALKQLSEVLDEEISLLVDMEEIKVE